MNAFIIPIIKRIQSVYIACLLISLSSLTAWAQSSKHPNFTASPTWVESFSGTLEPSQTDTGFLGLKIRAYDAQVHLPSKVTHYTIRLLILNQRGVMLSKDWAFARTFAHQNLQMHGLKIHRKDKTLLRNQTGNVLGKPVLEHSAFQLIEKPLAYSLQLSELQPGDEVEIAFSIQDLATLGPYYAQSFDLEEGLPVDFWQVKAFATKLLPLQQLTFNGVKGIPKRPLANGLEVYQWEKKHIPATYHPHYLPTWNKPLQLLQISNFKDWSAFGQWFAKHMAPSYHAHPRLAKISEEMWKESKLDTADYVRNVIRFIQDYLDIIGSTYPEMGYAWRSLDRIVKSRAATGHEKAYLIQALLAQQKIPSEVALTHQLFSKRLKNQLPGLSAFDQPVVHIKLPQYQIWIDPLLQHQGGALDSIHFPLAHDMLVVNENQPLWEQVFPLQKQKIFYIETFHMPTNPTDPVRLEVTMELFNGFADQFRSRWKNNQLHSLIADIENRYAHYPDIKKQGQEDIVDIFFQNQIRLTLNFLIPKITQIYPETAEDEFLQFSDEIWNYFVYVPTDWEDGIRWNKNLEVNHKIQFVGGELSPTKMKTFYIYRDHYSVGLQIQKKTDTLGFHYFLQQSSEELPKEALAHYQEDYQHLLEDLLWVNVLTTPQKPSIIPFFLFGLWSMVILIGVSIDPIWRRKNTDLTETMHPLPIPPTWHLWIMLSFLYSLIFHSLNFVFEIRPRMFNDPVYMVEAILYVIFTFLTLRHFLWGRQLMIYPRQRSFRFFRRTIWVLLFFWSIYILDILFLRQLSIRDYSFEWAVHISYLNTIILLLFLQSQIKKKILQRAETADHVSVLPEETL